MISDKIEKMVIKKYYVKGYFGKIKLKKFVVNNMILNKKMVRAILYNFIQFQIVKQHFTVREHFSNFSDLKHFSQKYNFPPYKLAKNTNYILSQKEMDWMKKYDLFTFPENIIEGQDKAKNFEIRFENKLHKFNIFNFKTEDELRKLKSHFTPDFYFPQGLSIGKDRFFWIDVKNFYGGNNEFTIDRLKKQANRYNNNLGNGCFVFKYDYNEEININNTCLFSYNDFFTKLKNSSLRTN